MNGDGATSEVEGLERARLQALVDGDVAVATDLHAEDYELITPGGATLSRDRYLGSIASGSFRYEQFEPVSEVRARVHEDTAILRYRVRINVVMEGDRDGGEFWHTDYWERRDGSWRAVWSHATRIRT